MVVVINGQFLKTDDIIASAWSAHHSVNKHEIQIALEFYHNDFGSYPKTNDINEFFDLLYKDGYISDMPVKPDAYEYKFFAEKDDYEFIIK